MIEPIARIIDSDPAEWAKSIGINLIGAYNVVRAVLPHMLSSQAGTILNISSGAAIVFSMAGAPIVRARQVSPC